MRYKKVGGSDKAIDPHPKTKYGIIMGKKDKIQKRRMKLESKK